MIPLTLSECRDKDDLVCFFQEHNDMNPLAYVRLALRKLRPSNMFISERHDLHLTPDQKITLQDMLDKPDLGWESYCECLTSQQIQCVGW